MSQSHRSERHGACVAVRAAVRTTAPGATSARAISHVAAGVLAALGLSGCAGFSMPSMPDFSSLKRLEIPDNDASFRTRIYAGAAIGNSNLDPDTGGTAFSVADPNDLGTQLRLGVDVHNMLSVELETSVLGAAELAEAGADVKYTSASVNALVYMTGGVQMRSRREGWSAYGKLGYGTLSKSSQVRPLEESGAAPVLGFGAEYGFDNGLGIRGELTRYDSDAFFFGLGAVYRFGLTPDEIGHLLVEAARPALSSTATHVGDSGRGLGAPGTIGAAAESASDDASRWRKVADTGGSAQGVSRGARGARKGDDDGDGIANGLDDCGTTGYGTSVDSSGCGLFDAVLGDVTFKPGSWWLSPRSRGALDEVADKLAAFPEVRIEVRAHTDSDGPADRNLALSARRAEAVVQYLRSLGISELQLESVGVGETQPLASNDSAPGRRRNRRVDLVTLPDLDPRVLAGEAIEGSVWHYPLTQEAHDVVSARAVATTQAVGAESSASTLAPATLVARRPTAEATADAGEEPTMGAALSSMPASAARSISRRAPLPRPGYVPGFGIAGVVDELGFESGSARLEPRSASRMRQIHAALVANPRTRIAVMAHTDDAGEADANLALSEERADAVVDRLVTMGIDRSRLLSEGYGETLPLVQNRTEADRARNRRIEIRVLR